MRIKQCLKCNHSAAYEGAQPEACPACGAIYSKVEEALQNGTATRPRPQPSAPEINYFKAAPTAPGSTGPDVHAFAEQMRAESLYPAWRKIVGFFTLFGYLVAALVLVGALISGKGSLLAMLAGAGTAAVIALFAKVGKELSLMLADLSDATVHLAAKSQDRE